MKASEHLYAVPPDRQTGPHETCGSKPRWPRAIVKRGISTAVHHRRRHPVRRRLASASSAWLR